MSMLRVAIFTLLLIYSQSIWGGSFKISFASQPDRVFHPGGAELGVNEVEVTVCINPNSENIEEIEGSLINAIRTWNQRTAVIGNISTGNFSGELDFESVALHELGHCVFGLDHVNGAIESMMSPPQSNSTVAYQGLNSALDINAGFDGIYGSSDDQRGDDINRHWYMLGVNDPFALPLPSIIDVTTFQRSLSGLPPGHTFAANGGRELSVALGYPPTESVMFQNAVPNEIQRSLTADDVATVKFAESGFDNIAGTLDDYSSSLVYAGVGLQGCDVLVSMEGFAAPNCDFISFDHNPPGSTQDTVIYRSAITFSPFDVWHYNPDQDPDEDGVLGAQDNCELMANPDQRDTNFDDFGNICDPDFDGNCIVNFADISLFAQEFGGTSPDFDLDGDGLVNFTDYAIVVNFFMQRPGPSTSGDIVCPFG